MRQLVLVLCCVHVAGCAASVEVAPEVGALSQALGEPVAGFPSPEERLGIQAINRARSDPATVKGAKSKVYPARPPIVWNHDLSRASRFHAVNMQSARSTLMHDSPCLLNANVAQNGCDGKVGCACQGGAVGQACQSCAAVVPIGNGCGTATFTRIGYFSRIATGEVAAAGYPSTWDTVEGWVFEAAGADGHRTNLLDVGITSNTMGFGHAGGGGCFGSFDVSDSGNEKGLVIPAVPSAAVAPARPGAGNARFWATWFDVGGAPRSLWVVVDGQCSALMHELGNPITNSTWYADVNLAAGCHSWYILGVSAGGTRTTYPTVGALQSGSQCATDYVAQQPPANCEANPPRDMAGGGGSSDLSAAGRDLGGGGSVDDLSMGGGGDLTGGGGGGEDLVFVPIPGGGGNSASGCSVAPRASSETAPWVWAPLLFAMAALVKRRRALR